MIATITPHSTSLRKLRTGPNHPSLNMAAPDKAALDALFEAHLSNLKSHQAMMRQMRDYVSGIQSNQSTPVAAELKQMNERAEKILQDAKRAGELMEGLQIQDKSPSTSKANGTQPKAPANVQTNDSNKPSWRKSKYDIEPDQAGNATKRQRISEHPNLYMPAFPPVLPPFPNGMLRSFQSMRPSWHENLFPDETKDEGSMQNRIIVANIPLDVHEEELRKHFESVGPVTLKHALRLPRLAETKIHGLSGECKTRYMATLDLSDYQAANRAASQLNGTRIRRHHVDPILVRHFCAPITTPTAGSKRRLSSDASNGSPQTCPQSKKPKRSPASVETEQNAKSWNQPTPAPSSSSPAPGAQQPKKRHADTVPVRFEAMDAAEAASSQAQSSATKPGKKARLDESTRPSARPQPPPMATFSVRGSPSTDTIEQQRKQQRNLQPQDEQQTRSDPADEIHPAYASSAQLALRSEFDDISNEVDRRLAEAHARRALVSKAVAAKARAGRKRKRSSFMSQATEEDETGNVQDEHRQQKEQDQQEGVPGDEPRAKRSKREKEAEKDAVKAKRRRSAGAADDGGVAAAKSSKANRRQRRWEQRTRAPIGDGGGDGSGGSEYRYETAAESPTGPSRPSPPPRRASKRFRRSTEKADCIPF
ncbi:hypothetical protein IWX49DRAFT_577787 [Phyllosticta citricarpa]|uniref:RRM domain-containing protein n=2 Tax=Phyllosticta TaxID=121621 RepID=A0ABR1LYL7_9PEZI